MWQLWQPKVLGDLEPLSQKGIQWMRSERAKRTKRHDYNGAFMLTWIELYSTHEHWWLLLVRDALHSGSLMQEWDVEVRKKHQWVNAIAGETTPFTPDAVAAASHLYLHFRIFSGFQWVYLRDCRPLSEAVGITLTDYNEGGSFLRRIRSWADDRDHFVSTDGTMFASDESTPHVGLHNAPDISALRATLRLPSGLMIQHEYARPIKVCRIKVDHIHQWLRQVYSENNVWWHDAAIQQLIFTVARNKLTNLETDWIVYVDQADYDASPPTALREPEAQTYHLLRLAQRLNMRHYHWLVQVFLDVAQWVEASKVSK